MKRATSVEQIITSHVLTWVLAVVCLALFIPGSFNWLVHPLVLALTIAAGAAIRVMLFHRRQRQETPPPE